MTLEEITHHLHQWQEAMQDADEAIDALRQVMGNPVEGPLQDAVYRIMGLLCENTAALIGTTEDWLQNWWLEDAFGARPLKVKLQGQEWREVKTIEELAAVIADERGAEK